MIVVQTHSKGNVIILSLKGMLNIDTTFDVEKVFRDQLGKRPKVIALDLKELSNLDSSGLGLFMKFQKLVEEANVDMVIYNITGNIVTLFDISKMESYFSVMSEDEFTNSYLR